MPNDAATPLPHSGVQKEKKRKIAGGIWRKIRQYFAGGSSGSRPPDSIVNWWVLLATVIIAVIYGLQLRAMIASNTINRDALQSVQRAFVVFSPKAGMGTKLVGNRITAYTPQIPVTNTGNTPTRALKVAASVYVSETPIGTDFTFPDIRGANAAFIGPKDSISTTTEPVDAQDVVAAQHGRKHVYVYGWTKYRDIFRDTPEHTTKFCYELQIDKDVDITDFKWTTDHPSYNEASFVFCPAEVGHNCSDEECDAKAN